MIESSFEISQDVVHFRLMNKRGLMHELDILLTSNKISRRVRNKYYRESSIYWYWVKSITRLSSCNLSDTVEKSECCIKLLLRSTYFCCMSHFVIELTNDSLLIVDVARTLGLLVVILIVGVEVISLVV